MHICTYSCADPNRERERESTDTETQTQTDGQTDTQRHTHTHTETHSLTRKSKFHESWPPPGCHFPTSLRPVSREGFFGVWAQFDRSSCGSSDDAAAEHIVDLTGQCKTASVLQRHPALPSATMAASSIMQAAQRPSHILGCAFMKPHGKSSLGLKLDPWCTHHP